MRGSEAEWENEVYMAFGAKDEIRHLGAAEDHCRMIRTDVQ